MSDAHILRAVMDQLHDGVYVVDRSHRITHWNPAATALTGYRSDEAVGRRCSDGMLEHVDGQGRPLCSEACPLAQTIEDGQARTGEVYLHHKNGHRVRVAVRVAPVYDGDGQICGAAQVFAEDIRVVTAMAQLREMERLALLDPLTGLPNRRHLEAVLAARLEEARRLGGSLGVLLADVDHFKRLNDRHGHSLGDDALRMVGMTLACDVRAYDLVGRWGGDEFLGIFPRVTLDELRSIAERKRVLVEGAFLTTDGGPVRVTTSIGIALGQPGEAAESLLAAADERLYESKARGRNCVSARAPAA
ncbi:MAG TPA: GGDEF domain-containing protein [Planctomycetota bacterium]|nr:GGDEF domain-containing protein [Planctomycetota bacterium]HRR81370.1 GGDEF domain-containing protein [Planctomycetota bacterium]HRT94248.1 GGDEF domain-containing protein [Planctomycetota bacterium]